MYQYECMVSNNTNCCDSPMVVKMACTNMTYRTSNILHMVVVRRRSSDKNRIITFLNSNKSSDQIIATPI